MIGNGEIGERGTRIFPPEGVGTWFRKVNRD